MPWMFTKYLQDTFDVPLYFQMTDDEKYLSRDELSIKDTLGFSYENALDVVALGFDPKRRSYSPTLNTIRRCTASPSRSRSA